MKHLYLAVLQKRLHFPLIDWREVNLNPDPLQTLDSKTADKYGVPLGTSENPYRGTPTELFRPIQLM